MRGTVVLCQAVVNSIKGKIKCGLYPAGTLLPSGAELCKLYHVSEKTIRRVIGMLTEDGMIRTERRKRPLVVYSPAANTEGGEAQKETADGTALQDILNSVRIFYYPLIQYGMSLCTDDDFAYLERMLGRIDSNMPVLEFTNILQQFWRFFPSKIGNNLILLCIDNSGCMEMLPVSGSAEYMCLYRDRMLEVLAKIKKGVAASISPELDLKKVSPYRDELFDPKLSSGASFPGWPDSISKRIERNEACISTVYMDVIGQIASGEYQPGDILPSHQQLCEKHDVSHDSTFRAIRYLRELGVIRSERRKSIIAYSSDEIDQVWNKLDPKILCKGFRLYIDALEAISLTIGDTAALTAEYIPPRETAALKNLMEQHLRTRDFSLCASQHLLNLIVTHIPYRTLRQIYLSLQKYSKFNRIVPGMLRHGKEKVVQELFQTAYEATSALADGATSGFVTLTSGLFHQLVNEMLAYCKEMDYLEATLNIYDGALLSK